MKVCPVCNDSFPDELNFCDLDGTRLNREAGEVAGQDRRKWWSLLGAGLLVGAVVISAASIIFLPKARVANPIVNSEPSSAPAAVKPTVDNATTVAAASPALTPDTSAADSTDAADAVATEPKKKEKTSANSNASDSAPNPKAAALAAEGVDTSTSSRDANKNSASSPKSETPLAAKPVSDPRPAESAPKPAAASPDVKRDQKTTAVTSKAPDKSSDKKKSDDKDKKKGGFLRVFKKIFGKD